MAQLTIWGAVLLGSMLASNCYGQSKTSLDGNPSRNNIETQSSLNGNNTGRPAVNSISPADQGQLDDVDRTIMNQGTYRPPTDTYLDPYRVSTPNGSMDINTNGSAPPGSTAPGIPAVPLRSGQPVYGPWVPTQEQLNQQTLPGPSSPQDRLVSPGTIPGTAVPRSGNFLSNP